MEMKGIRICIGGFICGIAFVGCHAGIKDGIILKKDFSRSGVQNGVAFDRAIIPVGQWKVIEVPASAQVTADINRSDVEIIMRKEQAYMISRPVTDHTIYNARNNIGCVTKIEGDKLLIATFGEHVTQGQGTLFVTLSIAIPANLKIERSELLEGRNSIGNSMDRETQQGWQRVETSPAPDAARKEASQ